MDDRRDAQASSVDEVALDVVGQDGGVTRHQAAGPGDPRDLADAVAQQLGPLVHVEPRPVGQLEHPGTAELGDLLLDRHPRQQVGDPLGDRQPGSR